MDFLRRFIRGAESSVKAVVRAGEGAIGILRFSAIVPASYVEVDYSNMNIGNIMVNRTGDLTRINRRVLYINIKPNSENTYGRVVGRLVTIRDLIATEVFARGDIIEMHPQLAFYLYIHHDNKTDSNYRPLARASFGPNFDAEFIDTEIHELVAEKVPGLFRGLAQSYVVGKYEKLQAKMMYYVLCHYAYIYMLKIGIYVECDVSNYDYDSLTSESDARKFLSCEQKEQLGIAIQGLLMNGFTLDTLVTDRNIKAMVDSVVGVKRKSIVGRCKNFFMGKTIKSNAEIKNLMQQCALNPNGNNSNANNMEGGKRKTRRHKKRKTVRKYRSRY